MHFRRREHDRCTAICTEILRTEPKSQAAIFVKCLALSSKTWIDDTALEHAGVTDPMSEDNAISVMPRPGTSIAHPISSIMSGVVNQCVRPVSSCRITSQSGVSLTLQNLTVAGCSEESFLDITNNEFLGFAHHTAMAKAICDYLIYFVRNIKQALGLCEEVSKKDSSLKDWWWKCRFAKCYYGLGLYRNAEHQLICSLQEQNMALNVLGLSKVYVRLDQPNTALKVLQKGIEKMPEESRLKLGVARIYEMMNATCRSLLFYKNALVLDASNIEALACLAANYFYKHKPELSLRYYRRLLQMGVSGPEIWNNLGLCCFYSSQLGMALDCFDRALQLADDAADVWYNIGHLGISMGDFQMAHQSFKIALSLDQSNAEALCNLGVLELYAQNIQIARAYFISAQEVAPTLFQPHYNGALLAFKLGNLQDSFAMVQSWRNRDPHTPFAGFIGT